MLPVWPWLCHSTKALTVNQMAPTKPTPPICSSLREQGGPRLLEWGCRDIQPGCFTSKMKQVPLPSPGQDVVPKYSEQQQLEGTSAEHKQPGWISAQPNLSLFLEITAAQEIGEESAETCSLHLHECSWATKADIWAVLYQQPQLPLFFGRIPMASWQGPTPHLHLLCHSPSSSSSRGGIRHHLQPCSPSARWLHRTAGKQTHLHLLCALAAF